MNILVVEDESPVRELLAMALKSDGHSVVEATDGKDALEHYAIGKFDLVLTDISMPKLDGLGLAKTLQQTNPSQAIILFSGDSDGLQKLTPNVKAVLGKPIRFAELKAAIRAVTQGPS